MPCAHLGAGYEKPLAQKSTPHTVDEEGIEHAARVVPSHTPPQTPAAAHAARPPRGLPLTGLHTPALSHASHWPVHAVSQHTPSTQLPFAHCEAAPQAAPPARFATQMPPEQNSAAAQSVSAVQLPSQRVPAIRQPTAPQLCSWSGPQLPLPWQADERVATPSAHAGARQLVPAPGYEQLSRSAPSHRPPHALWSVAHRRRAPCGAPSTAEHTPSAPATSQASHWPPQERSQQTPSTQKPDAHSADVLHDEPGASRGTQTPPEQ
jgi:hypothetical protein